MSLVNWEPTLYIVLTGALLASLPICWVAYRLRQRKGMASWSAPEQWQSALTASALFLVLDLVVFGAFTRLTDSGLGCPDWPGCYGSASPLGAQESISLAQMQAPHGPVTHTKAWIEMIHRYLATMVGALITVLMGMAWWLKVRKSSTSSLSPWWATATFVWVCVQGAFGAFTVTLKLYPLVVSIHLLGGLIGVSLLAVQVKHMYMDAYISGKNTIKTWLSLPPSLKGIAQWAWLLWMMQCFLGAWVSTNGAVLVCPDFPSCQGQWWPEMNWSEGFTVFRQLGENGQGTNISLAALTSIHVAHRLGATFAILALSYLIWRTWKKRHPHTAMVLFFLLLLQAASGLSNVVLEWPMVAALSHTLGAATMAGYLMALIYGSDKNIEHEPA